MSADYKFYHFSDGHFRDLNEDDFRKLCPVGCDTVGLMKDIRQQLGELKGAWTMKFLTEGVQCYQEGSDPLKFPYAKEPESKLDETAMRNENAPYKARNAEYRLQIKAVVAGLYDGKQAIEYRVEPQGSVNKSEPWENEVSDIFSEAITLEAIVKRLRDHFSVNPDDLYETLAKLDLGTTHIDLSADQAEAKYRIDRVYQAQAPSFRKQLISQLSSENKRLNVSNQQLKKEKLALEESLQRLPDLENNKIKYEALLDKLGLQHNVDEQVSQIAQTRHRSSLIQPLSSKLAGDVRKRLSPLQSEAAKLNELLGRIQSFVTDYIWDEATDGEIEDLGKDTAIMPEKLVAKIHDAVSDYLLYHFSTPDSRHADNVKRYRSLLNHYKLDFIDFSPGKSVTSKECRFVKALESEHPRGTCVETLASGIINLSSGYVIYKADVIISK
jgi:hypothetical protein